MTSPPKTITEEQAKTLLKLLQYPRDTNNAKRKGIRNFAMTVLMLDAGLRVGEVTQLKISDLWFGDRPVESIIVRAEIAKTKRERAIPSSQRIWLAIRLLRRNYWPSLTLNMDSFAFFANDYALPLTVRQVERILERGSKKSLGFSVNPHMLRHTFATRLMRVTNARVVQQLLGHSSLTSTQIYTHPNQDDLANAIKSIETTEQREEA